MKHLKDLIWLTQLGLSIAMPLGLFLWGAVWLRDRYDLGVWVLILGLVLGLYSSFSAVRTFYLYYKNREAPKKKDDPPVSFRDHD